MFTPRKLAAFAGAALSVTPALAVEKWIQPWTPDFASQESRVVACNDRTPLDRIAMDDFEFARDGEIVSVCWWGVVSSAQQRQRPYLVQFWSDANCTPDTRLQFECVTPVSKVVGQDCQGRNVVRFRAPLAAPFAVTGGTRYWFQVSEADEESVRPESPQVPNAEDFRWSEHFPIRGCAAAQIEPGPVLHQPLIDACYDVPVDLAFCLIKRAVTGVIPGAAAVRAATLEIRDLQTNALLETLPIDVDDDGSFEAAPELPDGTYRAVISSFGMKRLTTVVTLADGTTAPLTFSETAALGDLDGDNMIGVGDLSLLLESFGL